MLRLKEVADVELGDEYYKYSSEGVCQIQEGAIGENQDLEQIVTQAIRLDTSLS